MNGVLELNIFIISIFSK